MILRNIIKINFGAFMYYKNNVIDSIVFFCIKVIIFKIPQAIFVTYLLNSRIFIYLYICII